MSTARIQTLENAASEQRKQLQHTTSELRAKLEDVREKFSLARNLRDNFGLVSAVASSGAFLLGYAITAKLRGR